MIKSDNEKSKSYLGFAIKANKIVYGLDNILKYRKRIHLLIECETSGRGISKNLKLYSEQKCITLLKADNLEKLLSKENVKAVGILDKNLAKAIVENYNKK